MKQLILFVLLQIGFISFCQAQNEHPLLDSMESVFQTNFKGTKLFCSWNMELYHKANGQRYFVNDDSTFVEVDHYKLNSLPFFYPGQTYFETSNSYYSWMSGKTDNLKSLRISKMEEDTENGFIIFKIEDTAGKFYRLISSDNNDLYSFKIFDNNMQEAKQIQYLKSLIFINRDGLVVDH